MTNPKYSQINSDNDFPPKVILAIREISDLTVQELIEFINSNNRRRGRIGHEAIISVTAKVFNYYLQKFNFDDLLLNDKESFFKNVQNVIYSLECDTNFIENLKGAIQYKSNPNTKYDDVTFFSLDTNSIIDKVEFKYFDNTEIKKIENETSIVQLPAFDTTLYSNIIANPQLIYAINWREFEYLLSKILASFEYEVELQKGTKDKGIDIIAIKKDDIFGSHKYLIQAKKWKNKVGIEPVQRLAFLKDHYDVSKACLVTTSTFTKGAWELAKMYPWQLELKDYNGLLDWIKLAKME